MGLLVGFVELLGGVLLLASGISGASLADVIKGHAKQTFDANAAQNAAQNTGGASTSAATTADVPTSSRGAIDPVRASGLTVERIDQGRDFADTGGVIVSPEPGKIVAAGPVGTGWEGGGYIVEQLASGADIYFEEGVQPLTQLVGRTVQKGETIADLISGFHSGVEAGYATPTSSPGANYIGGGYTTLAQVTTGYTEGEVTPAGQKFAAWLKSLGFGS